uniref:Uncharacterized protein n=1 Tax=Arundo donax TaxID=35708 RepID=A0A0A9GZN0_ARUDO
METVISNKPIVTHFLCISQNFRCVVINIFILQINE